jgi:hypothetical protein
MKGVISMFRKTLLATTALVLGASVAFAAHINSVSKINPKFVNLIAGGHVVKGMHVNMSIGANNHRGVNHGNKSHWTPGATYSNFSKDANAEFISWFGFTAANSSFSSFFSSNDHFKFTETADNAVGFTGAGKKVKGMTFAGFAFSPSAEFKGVILSSVGGLPGNAVAHTASTTMSDTSICCSGARTEPLTKATVLASGTPYFASVQCANSPCDGGWNFEDTDLTGATVDYYTFKEHETYNFGSGTHTFSGSSPWHASTFYPEAGAVIVK